MILPPSDTTVFRAVHTSRSLQICGNVRLDGQPTIPIYHTINGPINDLTASRTSWDRLCSWRLLTPDELIFSVTASGFESRTPFLSSSRHWQWKLFRIFGASALVDRSWWAYSSRFCFTKVVCWSAWQVKSSMIWRRCRRRTVMLRTKGSVNKKRKWRKLWARKIRCLLMGHFRRTRRVVAVSLGPEESCGSYFFRVSVDRLAFGSGIPVKCCTLSRRQQKHTLTVGASLGVKYCRHVSTSQTCVYGTAVNSQARRVFHRLHYTLRYYNFSFSVWSSPISI